MSIYIEFTERNLHMKSKIIIALVILLIASLAGVLYLFNKNASLKNEMANQLAGNESVIDDLRSTNTQLETNISELEQTIADLEQQFADLQSANDELQVTIDSLEQITTQQEEDYFKEAETVEETKPATTSSQSSSTTSSTSSSKSSTNQQQQQQQSIDDDAPDVAPNVELSPEAQAFWNSVGGASYSEAGWNTEGLNGGRVTVDVSGIEAQ